MVPTGNPTWSHRVVPTGSLKASPRVSPRVCTSEKSPSGTLGAEGGASDSPRVSPRVRRQGDLGVALGEA